MHIRKYIWGICYGFILTAFIGYVLLDTFVIKQVYSVVPSEHSQIDNTGTDIQKESTSMQEDADISMSNEESDVSVITDRSYEDNKPLQAFFLFSECIFWMVSGYSPVI